MSAYPLQPKMKKNKNKNKKNPKKQNNNLLDLEIICAQGSFSFQCIAFDGVCVYIHIDNPLAF